MVSQRPSHAIPLDPIQALSRLEQSKLLQKLYDALKDTAEAVEESERVNPTRKVHKGKVTLEIGVARENGMSMGALVIASTIKVSKPTHEPLGATLFFRDGELFRVDPYSDEFEGFREIEAPAPAFRDPDQKSAAVGE